MKLALVIQGLLERTRLFAPFEGAMPNILNPGTWEGRIRLINNAENTLADGRPKFHKWLRTTNGAIKEGLRITGYFPTHGDYKYRMDPKNARGPNHEDYHTIIKKKDGFAILFSRHGDFKINRRRITEITRRGTYKIYDRDDFFVCIDNASIEDMEYYIKDRRHRHQYETMIPTLKKAIEVKRKEIDMEQPFKELLHQKLNEIAPCSMEQCRELISWWKHKTTNHRPLMADDQKAYRMILSRFKKIMGKKNSAQEAALLKALGSIQDIALVRKTNDNLYSVYRKIPSDPVYVDEETWKITRNVPTLTKTRQLVLPIKRNISQLEIIHQSDDWPNRPEAPTRAQYLPASHVDKVLPAAQKIQMGPKEQLLAIIPHENKFLAYTASKEDVETNPTKTYWSAFTLQEYDLQWDENFNPKFHHQPRNRYNILYHNESEYNLEFKTKEPPLYLDKSLMAKITEAEEQREKHNSLSSNHQNWITRSHNIATDMLKNKWTQDEMAKFTTEGGNIEFFEDHLKTLFQPCFEDHPIRAILAIILDDGGKPAKLQTKTLQELLEISDLQKYQEYNPQNVEALSTLGWKPAPWPLE